MSASSLTIVERLRQNYLDKVFAAFELTNNDCLVAVTDRGVDQRCRIALQAAIMELSMRGVEALLVESEIPTGPAQDLGPGVEALMEPATAILYHTSMSRSHCPQTHKFVLSDRPGRPRARLISITNGRVDTLLEGAVSEDLTAMRARIGRINRLTEGVERFHITAPAGTDLWLTPWPEMMAVDNGLIAKPGQLGNFPFGEGRSCAVKFAGTNGIVVSDGVIGASIGQVDKPIIMEICEGKIISMKGGNSCNTLVTAMEAADRKMAVGFPLTNPSYHLAEIAFGMNAAAWRIVDRKKVLPPTSLEAEKAYDAENTSIHIAHGANYIFGVPKSDPHYNPVEHHTDHVLCGGITVDAFFGGSHSLRLINDGRPIY